ncbi:MAG: ABC transporter permease [Eubacterium sp.]|nr:ABC transporter permease [Eubacterium sp.]
MKSLRLSLFNIKKNKKEAIGILFLTLITTFMLSIVVINRPKIDAAFDESFEASGSYTDCVMIMTDKYRDEFRDILKKEYGIDEVSEGKLINYPLVDSITKEGDAVAYNYMFVTEKTERKMESFKKLDCVSEEKIAELDHPIWLPVSFQIVKGFELGDDFIILKNGSEYAFTVVGFYETGLYSSDGYSYKVILSDADYELFAKLFQNDQGYGEYQGLFFDRTSEFDYEDFLERCNEIALEDISYKTGYNKDSSEKTNETTFLEMFMFMLIFLSLVTLVASLFTIRHKISGDIEDQMQSIGVLEALGYRSREISLAYVYEYVILGGLGAVLGGALAVSVTPFVNMLIRSMIGRNVYGTGSLFYAFPAALAVILLVVIFALTKAATIKKYPPVTALRKGINTHNFKRNFIPLEKLHIGINAGLALKGFFKNIKASVGICICIIASGTALLFAAMTYDFMKDGVTGLLSMMGTDVDAVWVRTVSGVDVDEITDEIKTLPEVRKAFPTYLGEIVSVKGSTDSGMAIIFNDFRDAENIYPYEGRFPEHDNEVMICMRRSRKSGLGVGDSIILEQNGHERNYIITGLVGSMQNGGSTIFMTSEAYERLNIFARKNYVQVYPAEGVETTELEKVIDAHFGGSAKSAVTETDVTGSSEDRIRSAVEEKIAVLLNQYGVTDVDYAVMDGDKLITGNSRNFAIKETYCYDGIIKTQMVPIAEKTKLFTIIGLVLIAIIVGVLLYIITSNEVRRQRKNLGIMKGLGYSSKDLMKQIAIRFMPVTVLGVAIATVCGIVFNNMFWGAGFATVAETNVVVIIITDVLLLLFCYIVTYISAGKIRKISVTELMTE